MSDNKSDNKTDGPRRFQAPRKPLIVSTQFEEQKREEADKLDDAIKGLPADKQKQLRNEISAAKRKYELEAEEIVRKKLGEINPNGLKEVLESKSWNKREFLSPWKLAEEYQKSESPNYTKSLKQLMVKLFPNRGEIADKNKIIFKKIESDMNSKISEATRSIKEKFAPKPSDTSGFDLNLDSPRGRPSDELDLSSPKGRSDELDLSSPKGRPSDELDLGSPKNKPSR